MNEYKVYVKVARIMRKVVHSGNSAIIYVGKDYKWLVGKRVIVEILVLNNELEVVDISKDNEKRGDK